MTRLGPALALALILAPSPASAHPSPFSFVDVKLGDRTIAVAIVAHVFDVAHDLGVDSAELLDPRFVAARASALESLIRPRFQIDADGQAVACQPSGGVALLADRDAVKLSFACGIARSAGSITIRALMFPYDPTHQTFLNIYERGALMSQGILARDRTRLEYFPGTTQGTVAVIRKFVPAGIHHILIGPDHLLFLVGLLLLGGPVRRLLVVVTAFTLAHSVTLSAAAMNIVNVPARLIEPAIALSIVYVGADNLLVRGGRDVRGWIALIFGLVHGFGFANVLREMDLPARALGWSLFSFNVGVEIGQLLIVAAVASAIAVVWSRSEATARRVAFGGSVAVIAAGAFWFVQRIFFPGGV
jgi:hydrogenase/urease accessory protein HupE